MNRVESMVWNRNPDGLEYTTDEWEEIRDYAMTHAESLLDTKLELLLPGILGGVKFFFHFRSGNQNSVFRWHGIMNGIAMPEQTSVDISLALFPFVGEDRLVTLEGRDYLVFELFRSESGDVGWNRSPWFFDDNEEFYEGSRSLGP